MEFIHASEAQTLTAKRKYPLYSSDKRKISMQIQKAIDLKQYATHIRGTIDPILKDELEDFNYNINYDEGYTTISWK